MAKTTSGKLKLNKETMWLHHFLNESCPSTFLNKSESARRAGYDTASEDMIRQIGCQVFTKLTDKISEWIEEHGLSENALKAKLLNLMNAKETKFFQKDGIITETRDVEAIETQRRTLDMAMKVKGLYEKDNLQKGDVRIKIGHSSEEEDD